MSELNQYFNTQSCGFVTSAHLGYSISPLGECRPRWGYLSPLVSGCRQVSQHILSLQIYAALPQSGSYLARILNGCNEYLVPRESGWVLVMEMLSRMTAFTLSWQNPLRNFYGIAGPPSSRATSHVSLNTLRLRQNGHHFQMYYGMTFSNVLWKYMNCG